MSHYIHDPADIPEDHPDPLGAFVEMMDQGNAQKQAQAERVSELLHGCDKAYFEKWKKQQEPQLQKSFAKYWETADKSIAPLIADDSSPAHVDYEVEAQLRWAMETEPLEQATLDWEEVTRIMEKILDLIDKQALQDIEYQLREISVIKQKMRAERLSNQEQTKRTSDARLTLRNWKSQHNPLQILERFPNEYLKKLWDIRPKPVQPPQFDINLQSSLEMSDTERTKFAVIVEQTSMLDYIKAGRKWATNDKKEELSVNEMLFLVFRAGSDAGVTFAPKINTTAIAYMAFCLAQDDKPNDNRNVVYIWELHVSEAYRGQGIGSFMLDTVETIARTIGRSKTMLTVFTTNHRAIALYKKKGYTVDAASPPDRVLKSGIKKAPYKIMSMDWGNDDEEATDEEGELMQLSD